MKEIKMDYAEYEAMVELIKEQQKTIEEFMKESRVVLIDKRYNHYNSTFIYLCHNVPKIITTDESLAKEYLKKEFNELADQFIEVKGNLSKLQDKPKKCRFW